MSFPSTYYITCSPITIGCKIYLNNNFTTTAPDGYYSNGTDVYHVTGGFGVITNITTCPTTTPCPGCSNQGSSFICCYNTTTGLYTGRYNAGAPGDPGCCCLGEDWIEVENGPCIFPT